jgi:hypothetical protein
MRRAKKKGQKSQVQQSTTYVENIGISNFDSPILSSTVSVLRGLSLNMNAHEFLHECLLSNCIINFYYGTQALSFELHVLRLSITCHCNPLLQYSTIRLASVQYTATEWPWLPYLAELKHTSREFVVPQSSQTDIKS